MSTPDELAATEFLDHDSDEVAAFVDKTVDPGDDPRERAVKLYYAVRDGLHYEVYGADLSREGMKASAILRAGTGFCIHKSLVYAAVLRRAGVPSRLFYGDVVNHLASDRLRDLVGGNLFRFHALTLVGLDGRWIKSTPVFTKLLCRLYRMRPLEFDGVHDSLYHPYDLDGRRHMEFVTEHGDFADFPYDLVVGGIRSAHPKLAASGDRTTSGSLVAEAERDDHE
ncbi:transglutaminase-like domain-containing protein [Hamadaea tsunoensis]|uniref:transglutaminase-like domain-containing protein n=1 Tax=Hamadaea tsunoensis TaxID=53368 RepID=UPI00041233F0|nr:transglutaminase-like domain-containing protein [Hamadaea tsunoensis]